MIQQDQILTEYPQLGNEQAVVWQLGCPECGEDTVESHGGDSAAVTVSPDRDAYDSPIGTRGGFTTVRLFCPSGHGFDLIIANHKGSEFIGIRLAGERSYEYGPDDEPYIPDPA